MNFEAIKPRIFNAIAVGEIHLTVAPSPKRIADATYLKSHHAKRGIVVTVASWWHHGTAKATPFPALSRSRAHMIE